jgi:hypothetical protein
VDRMNPQTGKPNIGTGKPGGGKKPGNKKPNVRETREEVYFKYAWLLSLVQSDDTGTLRAVFDWAVKKYVENSRLDVPLTLPFTESELQAEIEKTAWKRNRDSIRAQAEIDRARFPKDWDRSVSDRRTEIQELAQQYGVVISPDQLNQLALEARLNGWGEPQIRQRLEPLLRASIERGDDATGTAGDVQTQLLQWAARQGISIPRDVLARLVSAGALGRQGLEDMKAEIRRMYLVGAYPGWAKQIEAGADPYDLAAPFRGEIASLLELNDEEIGLDDPLLGQAMQGGMTLTDLRRVVRKDPRWQYTDNAHKTYGNVATDLLSMFGFR